MNSLIEALGLDVRILIAQFINFAVLVFVLWKFAYKPVFKILEERREKIRQGLEDSEKSKKRLEEADLEKESIISEAKKQANQLIEEAKDKAGVRYQEIVLKAKQDLKVVIEDEKQKIAAYRQQAFNEVKKDAASLIASALEKILEEKIDENKDKQLIEKMIKNF